GVLRDFEGTRRAYLRLLGVRSTGTLHWLFERTFPELAVAVERATLTRDVQLDAARMGEARLGGHSVLGGRTRVPVPGFHAILTCEEEHTDFERPWADEVQRRLATVVFPAIAESAVDLRVSL